MGGRLADDQMEGWFGIADVELEFVEGGMWRGNMCSNE